MFHFGNIKKLKNHLEQLNTSDPSKINSVFEVFDRETQSFNRPFQITTS